MHVSRTASRTVIRPCAVLQPTRRGVLAQVDNKIHRCHASSTPVTPRSDEDNARLLRAVDQNQLLEVRSQLNAFISRVEAFTSFVGSASDLKTSHDSPHIAVPYTLGNGRQRLDQELSSHADTAIAKAKHVRQHIMDLQYGPYPKKTDAATAMMEFEKEIEGWDLKRKEDTLQNWMYEEEAQVQRLRAQSQSLLNFVLQVLKGEDPKEDSKGLVEKVQMPVQSTMANAAGEEQKTEGAAAGAFGLMQKSDGPLMFRKKVPRDSPNESTMRGNPAKPVPAGSGGRGRRGGRSGRTRQPLRERPPARKSKDAPMDSNFDGASTKEATVSTTQEASKPGTAGGSHEAAKAVRSSSLLDVMAQLKAKLGQSSQGQP